MSGLSYVPLHLRRACRGAGLEVIEIDIIKDDPSPDQFREIEPLRTALQTLHQRFGEMLLSEGFDFGSIQEAKLTFEFTEEFSDDYCSNCHAYLVSMAGKTFLHSVNYLGQTITPNKALQSTPKRLPPFGRA
ncbi:MAG: hypothetical protein KJ725_08700 [Gammaproteobacteria bacterium]|nr:hypothetical protein [Gammaproteobacteria bacterium]